MAKHDEYTFPDEEGLEVEAVAPDAEIDIEVVDDTPAEDKNQKPIRPEIIPELEAADTSEDYTGKVQQKFKQYKKVWHDERRAKEQAIREQIEAVDVASKVLEENKRLRSLLESGEQELISTYQSSAEMEVEKAKRAYKDAYDNGQADDIVEAQQELIRANQKLDKAQNFRPTMQNLPSEVPPARQQPAAPQQDPKVAEWVAENPWFTDPTKKSMSRFAIGVHEDLLETYGQKYIGTDDYFDKINKEVAKRFPEEFESEEVTPKPSKPSTVVASAKRSTAPRRIVLTATQVALAKKFGLTPEQYAREITKLEA